jgi:hypothetical protein
MIRLARILLLLSAIIWCAFSAWYFLRPNTTTSMIVIAVLMLINSAIFATLAWLIAKKNQWIFYFAILFLAAHIVLTITDQFGIFDLLVLVIDLATLGILLFNRQLFTEKT